MWRAYSENWRLAEVVFFHSFLLRLRFFAFFFSLSFFSFGCAFVVAYYVWLVSFHSIPLYPLFKLWNSLTLSLAWFACDFSCVIQYIQYVFIYGHTELYGNIFSRSLKRKNAAAAAAAELNVMNMHDRTMRHVFIVRTTMLHTPCHCRTHKHLKCLDCLAHFSCIFCAFSFYFERGMCWKYEKINKYLSEFASPNCSISHMHWHYYYYAKGIAYDTCMSERTRIEIGRARVRSVSVRAFVGYSHSIWHSDTASHFILLLVNHLLYPIFSFFRWPRASLDEKWIKIKLLLDTHIRTQQYGDRKGHYNMFFSFYGIFSHSTNWAQGSQSQCLTA